MGWRVVSVRGTAEVGVEVERLMAEKAVRELIILASIFPSSGSSG